MIVITTLNVNTALARAVKLFRSVEHNPDNIVAPRGMRTLELPEPCTTVYLRPWERVLFLPQRDANPFFHLFESLWMLAGRNDVKFPAMLNRRMGEYSDDGDVFHGAYGFRWRQWFGFDQIAQIVALLRSDASSRRAVLSMWSANGDLAMADGGAGGVQGKDVPCNTHIYFKLRNGRLNMTVCNRSNDAIWGAYGANVVHMSMLHEYVANKLNVPMGVYRQVSDSLHVYLDGAGGEAWRRLAALEDQELDLNPYATQEASDFPLGAATPEWDRDLREFFTRVDIHGKTTDLRAEDFRTPYFRNVIVPLWRAWVTRNTSEAEACAAPDWRRAALEWMRRRV